MTQMDRYDGHLSSLADDGAGVPMSRFFDAPQRRNSGNVASNTDAARQPSPQQESPTGPRGDSSCKVQEDVEDDTLPIEILRGNGHTADAECNGDVVAISSKSFSRLPVGTSIPEETLDLVNCSEQVLRQRLEVYVRDVQVLSRDLIALGSKLEDSEEAQRNRVQAISERVYEAERHLAKTEERQDDAIEKASATFQKQSANLMHVINQVNSNFEHLSSQIAQQGTTVSSLERTVARLQAGPSLDVLSQQLSQLSQSSSALEHRVGQMEGHFAETRRATESLAHQVSSNEVGIQQHKEVIEQDIPEQRREINDLHLRLEALRASMTPRSQLMEVESNYRSLQDKLDALHESLQNVEARCDRSTRASDEMANLMKMRSDSTQHINGTHSYATPSISATGPATLPTTISSMPNLESGNTRRALISDIGPPGDTSLSGPSNGMGLGDSSVGASASGPAGGGQPSAIMEQEGTGLVPRTSWLSAFSSLPPPDHDLVDGVRRAVPSAPRGFGDLGPTTKLAVRQSGDEGIWATASPGDRTDNNSMYEELFQDYIPSAPWEVSSMREEDPASTSPLREMLRVRQPPVTLSSQQRLHDTAMGSNAVGIPRHH